ncbi:MAG: CocE/NonD family hydrolase, partial [Clostridia bacterium]|nr:CocE/NonD family hydrolase [Clostridia bacterium]
MKHTYFYEKLNYNNADLFTLVWLPEEKGKFPSVLFRSPYVDHLADWDEDEICKLKYDEAKYWLEAGYAYIYQHCRGRGKSSGDCIPYINERADGLFYHDWVRARDFYNGEIFLCGISYTAAVHEVVAPYAEDIKGVVLDVMDPFRYNGYYRNGFFKVGLHGGWYTGMYKQKTMPDKGYDPAMFDMLPLSEYSQKVFGEKDRYFDEALKHPDKNDPYWTSEEAGGDYYKALLETKVPVLL